MIKLKIYLVNWKYQSPAQFHGKGTLFFYFQNDENYSVSKWRVLLNDY